MLLIAFALGVLSTCLRATFRVRRATFRGPLFAVSVFRPGRFFAVRPVFEPLLASHFSRSTFRGLYFSARPLFRVRMYVWCMVYGGGGVASVVVVRDLALMHARTHAHHISRATFHTYVSHIKHSPNSFSYRSLSFILLIASAIGVSQTFS